MRTDPKASLEKGWFLFELSVVHRASVAQLVEHRAVMQVVASSNQGLKKTEGKVLPSHMVRLSSLL